MHPTGNRRGKIKDWLFKLFCNKSYWSSERIGSVLKIYQSCVTNELFYYHIHVQVTDDGASRLWWFIGFYGHPETQKW